MARWIDIGSPPDEALVERGVADAWQLRPGDEIHSGRALLPAGLALKTGVSSQC